MNVGANDLGAGLPFIQEMQQAADFPFISANIRLANQDQLLFEPDMILDVPGLKVGFVGITTGDKRLKDFAFADPVEAAQQAVGAIRDKVDLIFLLANVDDRMETQLTEDVKGIDFLVRSKTGSLYRNPKERNKVVVIRPGKQGKYAGILKVQKSDPQKKLNNVSPQYTRIKFADNRLRAMARGLDDGKTLEEHYANDEKRLQLIQRLRQEKATNQKLIKELKNSYYFEAIPLNAKIADTPDVAAIVADFMPDDTPQPVKGKLPVKEK